MRGELIVKFKVGWGVNIGRMRAVLVFIAALLGCGVGGGAEGGVRKPLERKQERKAETKPEGGRGRGESKAESEVRYEVKSIKRECGSIIPGEFSADSKDTQIRSLKRRMPPA